MTNPSIICVVYVSTATRLMSGDDLDRLLALSRRNNAAQGITGQLLYAGGNFIQAVEGSESVVDELLARLEHDPRHKNVVVIARWPISQRAFADWSMAYRRLPVADFDAIANLLPEHGDGSDMKTRRDLLAKRLLAEFARGNR